MDLRTLVLCVRCGGALGLEERARSAYTQLFIVPAKVMRRTHVTQYRMQGPCSMAVAAAPVLASKPWIQTWC